MTDGNDDPVVRTAVFKPMRWPHLSDRSVIPSRACALALETSSDGVLVADMRSSGQSIVYVNPAFERITGYPAAEALGRNCRYLQGADRQQPELAEIRAALAAGRACAVKLRNYRRDGTLFRNLLRLVPYADETGKVTHYIGHLRDVTQAAGVDTLTGLLDRYGLLAQLSALHAPEDSSLLVAKFDILRFHDVNSGFGYDAGDSLLRLVASRLAARPSAALARVGTNSFALALVLDDAADAAKVVEEVLEVLKPHYVLPGAALSVQFAAGYAVAPADTDALLLIRQAGAALQRSKIAPAHSLHAFSPDDERNSRNRIRLASELQNAVPNQELLLHFQPQFGIHSGLLVGAEALMRWKHGVFGLQLPGRFIEIAEETGAILDIGAWGLRTLAACAAQINREMCVPVRFSFNVSAIEFARRDMVAYVAQILDETGCKAEWLTLELTESLMVGKPESIRGVFRDLRYLGVGISLDDFGTGYSNLSYLEKFPLTEIKIDRSFVNDAAQSVAKRLIVETVVKLGAALDIRVVAEGIATEAELALMTSLGCSVGQGFLFSPPLEECEFRALLEHKKTLRTP